METAHSLDSRRNFISIKQASLNVLQFVAMCCKFVILKQASRCCPIQWVSHFQHYMLRQLIWSITLWNWMPYPLPRLQLQVQDTVSHTYPPTLGFTCSKTLWNSMPCASSVLLRYAPHYIVQYNVLHCIVQDIALHYIVQDIVLHCIVQDRPMSPQMASMAKAWALDMSTEIQ